MQTFFNPKNIDEDVDTLKIPPEWTPTLDFPISPSNSNATIMLKSSEDLGGTSPQEHSRESIATIMEFSSPFEGKILRSPEHQKTSDEVTCMLQSDEGPIKPIIISIAKKIYKRWAKKSVIDGPETIATIPYTSIFQNEKLVGNRWR